MGSKNTTGKKLKKNFTLYSIYLSLGGEGWK
jgi:hypothetical protein